MPAELDSSRAALMKLVVIGFAVGAIGLGLSIASHPTSSLTTLRQAYPPECVVAIAGAPGYLPRAAFAIDNKSRQAVRVFLEGREGMRLPGTELGKVRALELKVFAHALPAGRNIITATADDDAPKRTLRRVIYVNNRGAETCRRRYYWPVM